MSRPTALPAYKQPLTLSMPLPNRVVAAIPSSSMPPNYAISSYYGNTTQGRARLALSKRPSRTTRLLAQRL